MHSLIPFEIHESALRHCQRLADDVRSFRLSTVSSILQSCCWEAVQ